MAPLTTRQNHSLIPAPPRAPKGPSTPPVPVTASIDPKVFAELFAGTVGIFILAVLFWKIGKFARSLNRHKVLREGNTPTTRYARTWYGWVSLETHNRNKAFFRNIFKTFQRWTAWKSTRTDYRWVWWDPGEEALKARRGTQRPLRWLPECVKSYDFLTADAIWNPRPHTECHGALLDGSASDLAQQAASSRISYEGNVSPLSEVHSNAHSEKGVDLSKVQEIHSHSHSILNFRASDDGHENLIWFDARTTKHSFTSSYEDESQVSSHISVIHHENDRWPYVSLDGHSSLRRGRYRLHSTVHGRLKTSRQTPNPKISQHSRIYRIWSARMQVNAARTQLHDLRDSSGPPGTPFTEMLASLFSEQSTCEVVPDGQVMSCNRHLKVSTGKLPVRSSRHIPHQSQIRFSNHDGFNPKYNTLPVRADTGLNAQQRASCRQNSLYDAKLGKYRSTLREIWPVKEDMGVSFGPYESPGEQALQKAGHTEALNDWELKLMDKLDRKLLWMFDETTPGQKPYHFAILANHWLNRETWLVIDPVSRVSQDARREWGDPRFNVPYPEPSLSARPKYPTAAKKRAYTPRINSWRAAVNRQRRVSGVREVVRTVELYDDSVEEPPDGHIDPACWILPKPPQGFEMSTKQKNAWYEGGAGWQETLEDWQHVHRGYRLRKALHEGRVNRNRVKEVATQAHRCCRTASFKLFSKDAKQTPLPTPPAI
ncbi:uncharacterized protein N7459_001461 [Penicillium hispanicum]|uniref:uncharacterized protein n=1 Tax=Penicillium hispanicum TaxID=1080232 RepID=UPI00253FB691|nr:uncharacterized protein N7459_001461 [Penicillium hispanicum]KAJ5595253.1 hypothetical protein N7459_001461 [Penicillium hispanicum]